MNFAKIFMLHPTTILQHLSINESILVICQELFKEDFDVFFRKKGNFNRPSVCI